MRTVVTREAEWGEGDRGRAFALDRYEKSLCPCGCGLPIVEATDPKRAFKVATYICYARRALDRFENDQAKKAEAEHRPDGWDSGHQNYVEDSFDATQGVKPDGR